MMLRLGLTDVPAWELVASNRCDDSLCHRARFSWLSRISGLILLMYGKRPGLGEIIRNLRKWLTPAQDLPVRLSLVLKLQCYLNLTYVIKRKKRNGSICFAGHPPLISKAIQFVDGKWQSEVLSVPKEFAFTIYINTRELVTIMCTPLS